MKITEELVDRVFRQVNEEIEKDYPSLDMANLQEHPEGSVKRWQVFYMLKAYKEVKK